MRFMRRFLAIVALLSVGLGVHYSTSASHPGADGIPPGPAVATPAN